MRYEYVKEENDIKDKRDKDKKMELMISIIETKRKLEDARNNYEFAEGNLIDYFLYEIKANQVKLDYLISTAKKNGVEIDLSGMFFFKNSKAI